MKMTDNKLPLKALIICLLFMAQGCGAMSALSTGSSMRIEVEVYKGPLSKEPYTQWGELKATLEESKIKLAKYLDHIITMAIYQEYIPSDDSCFRERTIEVRTGSLNSQSQDQLKRESTSSAVKCSKKSGLDSRFNTVKNYVIKEIFPSDGSKLNYVRWCEETGMGLMGISDFEACIVYAQMFKESREIIDIADELIKQYNHIHFEKFESSPANSDEIGNIKKRLMDTSELGKRIGSFKSFHTAQASLSGPFLDRADRAIAVNFANLASQLGNQMNSRADALLKLLRHDRRDMPLSVYLRDSKPTDYINTFAWNRATGPALFEDMLFHPFKAFTKNETMDRVRVMERLFADDYWSKVNTVFASGQGEVHMAFIKDEIGNWNLKSYENDPTEILKAYKDLTKAAIKTAIDSIEASATGGSSAALLQVASRLTSGKIANDSAFGLVNVNSLHNRTGKFLEDLKNKAEKDETALKERLRLDKGAEAKCNTATSSDSKECEELKEFRKGVLQEAQQILSQHEAMIETLQDAVVESEKSKTLKKVEE